MSGTDTAMVMVATFMLVFVFGARLFR